MLILIALVASAFGTVVGLVSGVRQNQKGTLWTQRAVYVFAWTMFLANFLMIYALLERDFSVSYVAQVGSHAAPTWVTVVSLWSSLEGSILFWGAIIGLYALVFTLRMRGRYAEYMPYALGVILFVCAFFSLLLAVPANPFAPTPLPIPIDGPGPNPLLQNHVLMVIHPPMLRGHDHSFRDCDCRFIARQTHRRLVKAPSYLDHGTLDLLVDWYHSGGLVGVRSIGMGRLLGLGSGRKRLLSSVAGGHRLPAFHGGSRT